VAGQMEEAAMPMVAEKRAGNMYMHETVG